MKPYTKLLTVPFGPALIEAYQYAEAQDCIGLLLTPSATTWCKSNDFHPEHHSFGTDHMYLKKKSDEGVMTYTFCSGPATFSPHLHSLGEMKHRAPDSAAKGKISNTIEKIKAYQKML